MLPLRGGEAQPLTRLDRASLRFAGRVRPRSSWPLRRPVRLAPRAHRAPRHQHRVEDAEREPPVRLLRVEVPGGSLRRITTDPRWIAARGLARRAARRGARAESLAYEYDHAVPPQPFWSTSERAYDASLRRPAGAPRSVPGTCTAAGLLLRRRLEPPPVFRTATVVASTTIGSAGAPEVQASWEHGLAGDYTATPTASSRSSGRRAAGQGGASPRGLGSRRTTSSAPTPRNIDGFELSNDGRTIVISPSSAIARRSSGRRVSRRSLLDERKLIALNSAFDQKPRPRRRRALPGALGEEVGVCTSRITRRRRQAADPRHPRRPTHRSRHLEERVLARPTHPAPTGDCGASCCRSTTGIGLDFGGVDQQQQVLRVRPGRRRAGSSS